MAILTGNSEFHIVGGIQAEAGKTMDWWLNFMIFKVFSSVYFYDSWIYAIMVCHHKFIMKMLTTKMGTLI